MIINCNAKCKLKGGTTSGKLDVESNDVICVHCGDSVSNISQFMKNTMKFNGEILRKSSKKPFEYSCLSCKKKVATTIEGDKLVCKTCKTPEACEFNVSKFAINAMKSIQESNKEIFDEDILEEVDLDE